MRWCDSASVGVGIKHPKPHTNRLGFGVAFWKKNLKKNNLKYDTQFTSSSNNGMGICLGSAENRMKVYAAVTSEHYHWHRRAYPQLQPRDIHNWENVDAWEQNFVPRWLVPLLHWDRIGGTFQPVRSSPGDQDISYFNRNFAGLWLHQHVWTEPSGRGYGEVTWKRAQWTANKNRLGSKECPRQQLLCIHKRYDQLDSCPLPDIAGATTLLMNSMRYRKL